MMECYSGVNGDYGVRLQNATSNLTPENVNKLSIIMARPSELFLE